MSCNVFQELTDLVVLVRFSPNPWGFAKGLDNLEQSGLLLARFGRSGMGFAMSLANLEQSGLLLARFWSIRNDLCKDLG